MTLNKTITTNVVEQIKSATILILIVGIAAFVGGVNYQRNSTVQVENKVVVEAPSVEAASAKK